MRSVLLSVGVVGGVIDWVGLAPQVAWAQVTPDGSLSTTVTQAGNTFTIDQGNRAGNNLFHSFSQFSVPTGGAAVFNNAADVQTIFSRVTGGNISSIDGAIRANGGANLFLLNPSGILFGPNASLNIGGSFMGTTASSVKFADGVEFSAINPTGTSLLTISVPVGLQMGQSPGGITVQGTGHNAQFTSSTQISGLAISTRGLQVQSNKTLALVGGDLAVNGGLLSAPGGRIELGSVMGGSVTLNSNPQGFTLSYPQASRFGNIQMTQRALASTRDLTLGNGGSIQIQGKQVSIQDGSLVLIQNRSSQAAGDITVNAAESLQIRGKSANFLSSSALVNETISSGAAGNVLITTPYLRVEQGGYVLDRTFSAASSGNIEISASEITVDGFAAGDTNAFRSVSQILAASHSTGKGGNVSISTQNLVVSAGANIAARPYSSGPGGSVTVKADTIQVLGNAAPVGNYFSLLSTATFGAGNAGDLNIDTRTLSVQAGARVSASSIILGNAGNLIVNASESIEVNGVKNPQDPSYIGTAVRPVSNQLSKARAGNTTLNTPSLTVSNGATVFVQNLGAGEAGTLTINANLLKLDHGASISASTKSGEGGNINLQIRDGLIMRHSSLISAEAGGRGDGGNIAIDAPVVAGFENSDIVANAVQGRGGNIQITTEGIFGLTFRPQLTSENDITASSQFGVNGIVQVNTIGVDPSTGLVELPGNLNDSSRQIVAGCAGTQGNQFVITGRGGIPEDPSRGVRHDRPWADVRNPITFRSPASSLPTASSPQPLTEATTWQRTSDGAIELVATSPGKLSLADSATCATAEVR